MQNSSGGGERRGGRILVPLFTPESFEFDYRKRIRNSVNCALIDLQLHFLGAYLWNVGLI